MSTIITPTCVHCGRTGQVELSTEDADKLMHGTGLIQNDLPHIDAPTREQLMTGTHPACWDKMMDIDAECASCGEDDIKCPKSKRPCGHHCNHSWTHDVCCWCGDSWGENGVVTHAV